MQPEMDLEGQQGSESGLTPLALAVKNHHISIAKFLIGKGANVNALNRVRILQ